MIQKIRAFGSFSQKGSLRLLNEDASLIVPERKIVAIADGYGAATDYKQNDFQKGESEKASAKTIAELCLERVQYFVENGLGDSEVTLPFVYRSYHTSSSNLVFNGCLFANGELFETNKTKAMNARAGANLLFAFIESGNLVVANIGTCAGWLIREGILHSLVTPRSYALFKGEKNPNWHFPLASLGHTVDLEPEIFEYQLLSGDIVVLATDGLHEWVNESEIAQFGNGLQTAGKEENLENKISQGIQRLMETAQENGSSDNQTMVVLVCS